MGEGALGGMFVPGEGILCTFTIPLACATQAVVNGVTLKLNFRVRVFDHRTIDSMVNGHGQSECYAISSEAGNCPCSVGHQRRGIVFR